MSTDPEVPTDPAVATHPDGDERDRATVLETRLRVPISDVDLASDRLWQAGAQAVEEVAVDVDSSAAIVELRTVLAATAEESAARLGAVASGWSVSFAQRSLAAAQTWRAFAKPVAISPRLTIVPAWQADFDRESANVVTRSTEVTEVTEVLIEPGSAFGLGDHPTTQLMLEALDMLDATRSRPDQHWLRGRRVLDVGTGTGVLAIVAARWGAVVTAVDVAPAAIEATLYNAALNGVAVDASTAPVGHCGGTYDIVLANILATTLIAMAADLRRLLAPAGTLVVSGILADSHDHVIASLRPLEPVATLERDGWAAVTLGWPERSTGVDS